jgi:hypothetical protein
MDINTKRDTLKTLISAQDTAAVKVELEALTSNERETIKAELVADALQAARPAKGALSWADAKGREYVIEAINIGVLDLKTAAVTRREDKADTVVLRLAVDGEYPNGDGWYSIANPPLAVPNGTKRVLVDEKGEAVKGEKGEAVMVDNMRLDPLAAVKAALEQVVEGQLSSKAVK